MTDILATIGGLSTTIFSTVGNCVDCIVSNDLLLMGVGFWFVGGAVGIMSRLLSRN